MKMRHEIIAAKKNQLEIEEHALQQKLKQEEDEKYRVERNVEVKLTRNHLEENEQLEMLGFTVKERDGEIFVDKIKKDSIAFDSDLRLDDKITHINMEWIEESFSEVEEVEEVEEMEEVEEEEVVEEEEEVVVVEEEVKSEKQRLLQRFSSLCKNQEVVILSCLRIVDTRDEVDDDDDEKMEMMMEKDDEEDDEKDDEKVSKAKKRKVVDNESENKANEKKRRSKRAKKTNDTTSKAVKEASSVNDAAAAPYVGVPVEGSLILFSILIPPYAAPGQEVLLLLNDEEVAAVLPAWLVKCAKGQQHVVYDSAKKLFLPEAGEQAPCVVLFDSLKAHHAGKVMKNIRLFLR